MYFPRNWEFGSALSKLRNFGGGGLNPPNPSLVTPLAMVTVVVIAIVIVVNESIVTIFGINI
jgi:hypothetical protein